MAAGYHHIACCIDTSETADAAVSQAGALRDGTTRLSLVHVAPPEEVMRGGMTEWEIDEDDPLSPPRRWLAGRAAESDATPVLLSGDPAHREACRWLAGGDADLVVAAAHSGRVARTLLGGFATALAHDAPVDTLIVPPRGAIQAPSHIACAVDDDGGSAGAVDAALRVAGATGARVSVVHAISPPRPLPRNLVAGSLPVPAGRQERADELVRDTAGAIPDAESVVVTGAPEDAISDWCREAGVDLLVVGPRSGRRAGLGGFAARIIRQAPCGVLLARDPAAGGDAQA